MNKSGSLITARVDEDAKRIGTAALQQAGYTPSQAVQVVWRYAASCAGKPDELAQTLDALKRGAGEEKAAEQKTAVSRRMVNALLNLRKTLGTENVELSELSWRELRELEYEERMGGTK